MALDTPEQIAADAAAPPQVPAPAQNPISQPQQPQEAAPMPAQAPEPQGEVINVVSPTGEVAGVGKADLQNALSQGYRVASDDEVNNHFNQEKYGGLGQQAIAALEGAASSATFGASTAAETQLGLAKPEDIQGRAETGIGGTVGQIAGLLIPGAPEAELLEAAGKATQAALFGSKVATPLAKIGSAAAKNAVETAMVQGGNEVSKMIADPNQAPDAVETAAINTGIGGLFGGVLGGGFAAIPPLWNAAGGQKLGAILHGLSDKAGGIEGAVADSPAAEYLKRTGQPVPPEVAALISGDKKLNATALNLLQTDTNRSGLEYQKTLESFRSGMGELIANNLGKTLEQIPAKGEIDVYEAGRNAGRTLADEYDKQLAPSVQAFEEYSDKYGELPLNPSKEDKMLDPELRRAQDKASKELDNLQAKVTKLQNAGDVEGAVEAAAKAQDAQNKLLELQGQAAIPGTSDIILNKVNELAQNEKWTTKPSSDIMKLVNELNKEVPNLKTLSDLKGHITQVGNAANKDFLNGPLKSAGRQITGILKDVEGEILGHAVGSQEGEEAYAKFTEARKAYHEQSKVKDYLDSVLHAKGSTSGYAKSLRAMAQTDGEKVARLLSGKNDADLLNFLSQRFPETARVIKDLHTDQILSSAFEAGKLSPNKLTTSLSKLSPQLKSFLMNPEQLARVQGVSHMVEQLRAATENYNYSNSGRLAHNLLSQFGAGAASAVTAIAGHSPVAGLLTGGIAKAIGKDIPDAYRLALLKRYGSTAPTSSAAFRNMAEFIDHTIKGENLLSKATKNIFKAGAEVLPKYAMPTEKDRQKLDKQLKEAQKDPSHLIHAGGETGHYMPEHGGAIVQTVTNATNYLNGLRPQNGQNNPLDTKLPPSKAQQATYDNALNIAQQPLVIFQKLAEGRLTSQDVIHLNAIYPNLYKRMQDKMMSEMTNQIDKGQPIPYRTRIGMALFTGQPLDSTMTPDGIIAAQPQQPQGPQMQGQPQGKPPTSNAMKGMSKLPNMYKTPGQASDERRSIKQ